MGNPTRSDVHVNGLLTNISTRYMNATEDFIASKVFPNVPVAKQSDRYLTYDKAYWFKTNAKSRGLSQESAGTTYTVDTTTTYYCDVKAVHHDIDDQVKSNADSIFALDRNTTELVTNDLLLKRELDFATNYFSASIWAGAADLTPAILWDAANSIPITDIRGRIFAIKTLTGKWPNTLTLGAPVWKVLQDHPDVLARIKSTADGVATTSLLANILGLDRVLIGAASKNTAQEGLTAVMADVFGNDALLTYSPPSPGLMTPSSGYTFSWNGYLGATKNGNRVKRFRIDTISSDRIEGEMAYDLKVIGSDLGAFFLNVVS